MDAPRPKLHSLDDSPLPSDLAADVRALLALPEEAQRKLWEVLGPALAESIGPDLEAQLDAFCERHGVAGDVLSRALKASRFLLRSAVKLGVERDRFAADLAAIGGDDAPRLAAILLPGFEAATRFVRREIVRRTLGAHGKVVEGVDWRIEKLVASNDGELDHSIVTATLRYREGDRSDRITLQFEPEMLAELARAHARLGDRTP